MSGFWEPHTSSIDFCEPNYALSPYIAEFHNTWSSLVIALMGLVGMLYGNPLKEWNVTVMFFILFIIGIGSAGLHSTLHWFPQSSDEIPMLWQTLSFLYVLLICQYESSINSYYLGFIFLFITAAQTFAYYLYQQIYAVFIVSMILYTAAVILWSGYLCYKHRDDQYLVNTWITSFVCFVLIGFVLWVIDMNLCNSLLPIYHQLYGLTLHILWHLFAGLGTYFLINFFVGFRLKCLGFIPHSRKILMVFPVFTIAGKKKA